MTDRDRTAQREQTGDDVAGAGTDTTLAGTDATGADTDATLAGHGSSLADTAPGRIDSRLVHSGRIVELSLDTVRFPDGSTGELEMIRHSGASAVLPVLDWPGPEPAESGQAGSTAQPDTVDPDVVLIRQYRYAAGGYMLEVPAGRPDQPGEDWELCARRELEEEAGLVAGQLRHLTTIYTTPGFTDERIHLYLATDCTAGTTRYDHDEFIESVRMPLSAAVGMVHSGQITDAKTIATLLLAEVAIRTAWSPKPQPQP
jgi:ADP-ribose pyrophosphatase